MEILNHKAEAMTLCSTSCTLTKPCEDQIYYQDPALRQMTKCEVLILNREMWAHHPSPHLTFEPDSRRAATS